MADFATALAAKMAPPTPQTATELTKPVEKGDTSQEKEKSTPEASPPPKEAKAKSKAKETPPEKAEEKAPPKAEKWKLKADGEEFEWDPSDVEATKREIMLARGANKRFEEAAKQKRQAEQFFNMLKDPAQLKSLLQDPRIGVDVKKFAEDFVWEQMQEEQLSPEQKKQREIERELARYKEAEKAARAEAETKQAQELQARYEADYEKRIMVALQAGGVPNTKGAVRRMAYYLQQAVANDIDLQPADLVAQVRKDLIEEHKEMYSTADSESLLQLLGEDLAKKIRSADVKRLKSTQPEAFRKQPSQPGRRRDNAPSRKTMDQFRDEIAAKFGK